MNEKSILEFKNDRLGAICWRHTQCGEKRILAKHDYFTNESEFRMWMIAINTQFNKYTRAA